VTDERPLVVTFVHGLESNSQGTKARFLARHFDAQTPEIDTRSFEGARETVSASLRARAPDVLVGSSFGGAVALSLLQRGDFRGPTLLLAPAARAYGLELSIPGGVRVCIVHGRRDDLIDPLDSRALATTGTPGLVELVEVDDGHRLATLVESGELAELVRALNPARRRET
jgi:predicted esterase